MPKRDPYQRWLDARQRWREEGGNSLKPAETIAAELRTSVVAMLKLVAKGESKMPGDMAFELADAIKALSAGQEETFLLPSTLKLTKRKQPRAHPFLEDLRQDAVNYLRSVESGDYLDSRPIHTVAKAYSVNPSTVHRWRTKFSAVELSSTKPELIKTILRASANQYRKQSKRLLKKS